MKWKSIFLFNYIVVILFEIEFRVLSHLIVKLDDYKLVLFLLLLLTRILLSNLAIVLLSALTNLYIRMNRL